MPPRINSLGPHGAERVSAPQAPPPDDSPRSDLRAVHAEYKKMAPDSFAYGEAPGTERVPLKRRVREFFFGKIDWAKTQPKIAAAAKKYVDGALKEMPASGIERLTAIRNEMRKSYDFVNASPDASLQRSHRKMEHVQVAKKMEAACLRRLDQEYLRRTAPCEKACRPGPRPLVRLERARRRISPAIRPRVRRAAVTRERDFRLPSPPVA